MSMPSFGLALVGSYLIGSIPSAYLLVKWLTGTDVREVGSGNVGATNVTRVAGFQAGLVVFIADLVKGWVAVRGLAPWLVTPLAPATQLACGLAAVLGHLFPVWLQFRGGKGVATTIGVLVGAMPAVAVVWLVVWVLVFFPSRTVSLASLAAAVTIPITQLLTHRSRSEVLLGAILAVLIMMRHRANIARLLQGTEHRFGARRER